MTTKKLLVPLLEKELGPLSFGKVLRAARTQSGQSQLAVAKLLGMARGTLCDIEKGRQIVSPALAIKIARKMGFSQKLAVKTCLQDQLRRARIPFVVEIAA
jgi:transcriptional regulator with XRE-family HTH domain